MNLTSPEAKWISMLTVGMGSFVIGVIPTCLLFGNNRAISQKLIISSLLCFGGGVLLATSILHMLPETRQLLPEYAELVFCCGFLLLYLVDEVAHYFCWTRDNANHLIITDRPPTRDGAVDQTQQRFSSTCLDHGLPNRKPNNYRRDVYEIGFNAAAAAAAGGRNVLPGPSIGHDRLRTFNYESKTVATTNKRLTGPTPATNDSDKRSTQYGTLGPFIRETEASCCPSEETTFLCHGNHTESSANTNGGLLIGVSLALTVHAFLEGLAIGLQKTSSGVLLLLGAVVSHKFVVAFCLGLELAGSTGSVLNNIFVIALFSGGSVLGIGLGTMAVKVEGSLAAVAIPLLQGLAGGTLLYVTASEILPRERARWHGNFRRSSGIIQFVSVLIGFAVIYCSNRYLDSHHRILPRR